MAELNFDSRLDYQKIYLSDSFSVSIANPNFQKVASITHPLKYVPQCKVWFTNAVGEVCPASSDVFGSLFSNFSGYTCYYTISSTALKVTFDRGVTSGPTINSTIYYRIYLNDIA